MAVTWNYGGSTSISVTLDTINGASYGLIVTDGSTQNVDSFTGTGSPMTRTITGLSGLSAGDPFGGIIDEDFTYIAANNFKYGTASTIGEGVTAEWAFDGIDTFTITFTGTGGTSYNLQVDYYAVGDVGHTEYGTPFTATGSSESKSLTLAHTPENTFAASLWLNQDTFTSPGSRLFTAAIADAGAPGNPEGGDPTFVGRVLVAFDDGPLEPNPNFTALDQGGDFPVNFVAGYDIRVGRQTLLSQTDTGTATVTLYDRGGLFDPRNVSSAYYGKLDGRQIILQLYNPVSGTWEPQFRGLIDDIEWNVDGSAVNASGEPVNETITLNCVDVFDYLAGYGLTPGLDGVTPPAGAEDGVYYAATAGSVDDRIIEILTDAGIDSTMYSVASGNVHVKEVKYDPDESALQALRDAADAELPFIANMYCDRYGHFAFRGRYGRFDPDDVAAEPGSDWDFTRWAVGDGAAIISDPTRAQMRILSFGRARSELVNAALCYPQGIKAVDMPGQVFADTTSINDFGKHSAPPMSDLLCNGGVVTAARPSGTTDLVETALFAELLVKNQKDPRENITAIQLKAMQPDGTPRATATWDLLTRIDISHVVNVAVGYPGGTGFTGMATVDDYYIEGRQLHVTPANSGYDYIELDLDVSAAVWSMDTHSVFPAFPG